MSSNHLPYRTLNGEIEHLDVDEAQHWNTRDETLYLSVGTFVKSTTRPYLTVREVASRAANAWLRQAGFSKVEADQIAPRPPGRPPTQEPIHPVRMNLPRDLVSAIDTKAAASGVSRTEWFRDLAARVVSNSPCRCVNEPPLDQQLGIAAELRVEMFFTTDNHRELVASLTTLCELAAIPREGYRFPAGALGEGISTHGLNPVVRHIDYLPRIPALAQHPLITPQVIIFADVDLDEIVSTAILQNFETEGWTTFDLRSVE